MTTNRRKICVITGTRAEYGLLRPVMQEVALSPDLQLQVIATGMHLLPEFGSTAQEILNDGFPIDARVPMIVAGDTKASMTLSIGIGIIGIAQALAILDPEIVVVLGDRFEAFAAAVAASYGGRIVAHIGGGDNPRAGYDEYSRHAITKISHLHFASTAASADRIRRLGESGDHIQVVGSTALDTILRMAFGSRESVRACYGISDGRPWILMVQHPVSTLPSEAGREFQATLEAVFEVNCHVVLIHPNVDPGHRPILDLIQEYERRYHDRLKVFRNLPFSQYLELMNAVDLMVGNSSSGIIESPALHLAVVNIGDRQMGREHAENVIHVPAEKTAISRGIHTALHDPVFRHKVSTCRNPYGDGRASERIVQVLRNIRIDDRLRVKHLEYGDSS